MGYLGSRLEAVAELISDCENNVLFADIGSDHAFLAREIIKRGIAKIALAADINEMPLLKGKENAESQATEIEFVLSDGFDELEDKNITSAAICGMGGELIAKILQRSQIARKALLALQPMSAQEELRKYLWENGFSIHKELFVFEADKPYTVMQVTYTDTNTEYSYLDIYLGKERPNTPEFAKYCNKVCESAKKRRKGVVARNECTNDIDGLIEFCQTQTTSL